MFDLGFAELLVIGIVALIVVGPKELPVMFRRAGQFVGRMRGMAREFTTAMNQAADEAGVKDIQKSLKAATDPVGSAFSGVKDAAKSLSDLNLDPDSETGKLAAERAENARKIQAATARRAAERKAKEAEEALKRAEELEAEVSKPPATEAKTAEAVPAAPKKAPAAKKPPAKASTAARTAPASKKAPAAKGAATRKPAAAKAAKTKDSSSA